MKLQNVIAERPTKKVYLENGKIYKQFNESVLKSDVLNEALNHSRVEESGLCVSKLLDVTNMDGKWTIVLEYIEGKTLQQLMDENPDRIKEYMSIFVDIQLRMHEKKVPLLNKLKDKMNRKISETTLSATTRYELHSRLEGMPKHTKLCHGDYNPSNVVFCDDGNYYIIDWSHATQGNASADAARTYLLFNLNDQAELADLYLKMFCAKSNTAKQYVQKWLPIVAASQSVKGKPEEREFLLSWVDVRDFE